MSAYRESAGATQRPDAGSVVEQIVRQFADRYAFVRELVQNSLDADATAVAIRVAPDDRGLSVRFEDDGRGMTLEIIRGPLLTLFSSSKEGVRGKIGRYGVGFMSVFALDPVEVIVETHRAEGAYRVRLSRDHSFEVLEAPAKSGSGTAVTLLLAADDHDRAAVTRHVTDAARRWCRHVARPITVHGDEGEVRVNEPFALRAPVTVEVSAGDARAIVGVAAGVELLPGGAGLEGPGRFAGFYAHGLTLLETTDEPTAIPGIRFKVQCGSLAHTISRDDVRRDAAFDRVMALVRGAARKKLTAALTRAQHDAAVAAARDGESLVKAAPVFAAAAAWLEPSQRSVALLEPLSGANVVTLARVQRLAKKGHALGAPARSPLTAELARRGFAIVRTEPGLAPSDSLVCELCGLAGLEQPDERFALIQAAQAEPQEAKLTARARVLLDRLGVPVADVIVVTVLRGAVPRATVRLPSQAEELWVLPSVSRRGRPILALVRSHPAVQRAAALADAARGAALLLRLAMVEEGAAVSAAHSDVLLEASMEIP